MRAPEGLAFVAQQSTAKIQENNLTTTDVTKTELSWRGKLAIVLGILASLSFFVAAFVVFLRERDWPAKYIYAGTSILAVIFIALRRRRRRLLQSRGDDK
jgi:hypothetical protein